MTERLSLKFMTHILSCEHFWRHRLSDISAILFCNILKKFFGSISSPRPQSIKKQSCVCWWQMSPWTQCCYRKPKCRTFLTFPNRNVPPTLSNQDRVGKRPTVRSLRMYLALKYGRLTNTWVAHCKEDGGLASSNNMARHKGVDKPLLFQSMPPLDLACLRDCQKNAFIIHQNITARIFRVMHNNEESSNKLIILLLF